MVAHKALMPRLSMREGRYCNSYTRSLTVLGGGKSLPSVSTGIFSQAKVTVLRGKSHRYDIVLML